MKAALASSHYLYNTTKFLVLKNYAEASAERIKESYQRALIGRTGGKPDRTQSYNVRFTRVCFQTCSDYTTR